MNWEDANSEAGAFVQPPRFKSFFMGGFECSTHRPTTGKRLDLIAATKHDQFALADYQRFAQQGLQVAREGVRWHLVEQTPGRYDFSSAQSIARAARETGTQVIWDLCHFGWPDHLDIFRPEFVSSLARFGAAFAEWLLKESDEPGFFVPVNEISFFSWAAGDEGSLFPYATNRGFELKSQLVRATIATIDAIRAVMPGARFVQVDPIIHVIAAQKRPEDQPAAEAYRRSQYQAWDMLTGRLAPELGGRDKYLDLIGVNFYPHNQWFYNLSGFRRIRRFTPISRQHRLYRPLREMLAEVHEQYNRPMIIAETGAENRLRAGWLRYVCRETSAALNNGVPIHGLCLYPILNHPGWLDNRHCYNALWDYPDAHGHRKIYPPLAKELSRWQKILEPTAPFTGHAGGELKSAVA